MTVKDILVALGLAALIVGSILSLPYLVNWTYNQGAYPTGVLVTYADSPVMGLNVHVTQRTWEHKVILVAEGPTDQEGYFTFLGKPAFQYTLALTYDGTEFSKTLPGGAIWNFKLPVTFP